MSMSDIALEAEELVNEHAGDNWEEIKDALLQRFGSEMYFDLYVEAARTAFDEINEDMRFKYGY